MKYVFCKSHVYINYCGNYFVHFTCNVHVYIHVMYSPVYTIMYRYSVLCMYKCCIVTSIIALLKEYVFSLDSEYWSLTGSQEMGRLECGPLGKHDIVHVQCTSVYTCTCIYKCT